ncbi:MAG: YbhB/YbcL family Raf kinase inhibitor-like protein [Ignavibacteriales bacterium]|nr:YbhB/YbcL family Raf kinase inhibitor-like protein [Ignavibacteriales bacterium]
MRATSKAFNGGNLIPTKYAYWGVKGGKNISIPLSWKFESERIQSFALSIIDSHPIAKNWVHWLVVNIPLGITQLPENISGEFISDGAKELHNSYGDIGYGGPQPPKGSGPHKYILSVYGLDVDKVELTINSSLSLFEKTIGPHIVEVGKLVGVFEQ